VLASLLIVPAGGAAAAGDTAGGGAAAGDTAPAVPGRGVVWLTMETTGSRERVRLFAPLEWLALIDGEGDLRKRAMVEGIAIDPDALWETHRSLPLGTARELERGVTSEGDPYVLGVRCDSVTREAAGKLHVLTRNAEGKVSDVRFPLDLPALFTHLLSSFQFHVEEGGEQADVRMPARDELLRLGSYGTFTLIEVWKPDEQVKISIE
jgi:hypothetical protein